MFHPAAGTKVIGARSMEEMVAKLKKPRRVMMLVKAGSAVDGFIDKLVSYHFSRVSISDYKLKYPVY